MADHDLGGFDPPIDQPPAPPRRRRNLVIAAVALLVLAIVAAISWWPPSDEPVAAPVTTRAPSTTTTKVKKLPSGTVEIATAKATVTELDVFAAEPPEWATAPAAHVPSDVPVPPQSQPTAPDREPLPAKGAPIVGRSVTETGWRFTNPGPYEPAQPFTMLVQERRGDWLRVHVPVRPNGTTGYVRTADVDLSQTQHRVELHLGERMLRVFDGPDQFVETKVVIGSPFTPTPTGTFYITDIVPQTSPSFAPFALATNGYSEVMNEFDTGVPVVALHGTSHPEQVGEARSNGCVRIPNEIVQQLADTLPQGTPVYIFP